MLSLPPFPNEVVQRGEAAERYKNLIRECGAKDIVTPFIAPENSSVFAQFTVRVPKRSVIIERLAAEGVPTAVHYPKCLHQQPMYQALNYRAMPTPAAEEAADQVMSLPFYPELNRPFRIRLFSA